MRTRLPSRVTVWLLWPMLLAGGVAGDGARAQEPEAEAGIVTAPVALDGVELFRVRGVSSYPAEVRAGLIARQVTTAADDRTIALENLRTVEGEGSTQIMAGDVPIMTVVDADARLERVGRADLALAHLRQVRQAIVRYRDARTPGALRQSAANALAATALLMVALVALRGFWRRVDRVLADRLRPGIQTVEIRSFELMRADRIWSAVRSVIRALRMIVVVGLALVYLGFVLAQFPWTRALSQDMTALVLRPLQVMGAAFVAHIPSLMFLAVLFVVVRLTLRLVRLFFDAVRRGSVTLDGFDADWADPTYKIARLAIVTFALIVAYPYIPGSNTAAFQGVSLFIGIIFSLGSTAAISNIIAGYMMTYRRALKVGDRVRIGETVGDVIETRLQVTHLRSFKNEEIIVPNSQILAGEVLNYSSLARTHGLILHTDVAIGYDTPWRQVEALLLVAAGRTEGISKEPPPFVFVKRLGDFAVTYELNAYCTDVKAMARLYADLHRNILDVFNEYGVQIMTPTYQGDPPEPKVVPPQKWYTSPAIRPAAGRRGA